MQQENKSQEDYNDDRDDLVHLTNYVKNKNINAESVI